MPFLRLLAIALIGPVFVDNDGLDERPGLVATFRPSGSSSPTSVSRVVVDLHQDWGITAPDPRIGTNGFRARFEGMLLIQKPGSYRFFTRASSRVALSVSGRTVVHAEPLDLTAGMVPIAVEGDWAAGRSYLDVDWSGPEFEVEPLPARLLFHDPAKVAADSFEEGRRLADRLGCANCHTLLNLPAHRDLGPPLDFSLKSLGRDWLMERLTSNRPPQVVSGMPGYGLKADEVNDLLTFLTSGREQSIPARDELKMARNVADASKGRLSFRSVGCLGCHASPRSAEHDPRATAPDLTDAGRKRSAATLAGFLVHAPRSDRPSRHRPDMRLTPDEAAHLGVYLAGDAAPTPPLLQGDGNRGRGIAERLHCGACHALSSTKGEWKPVPIEQVADGCLAESGHSSEVPRFRLTTREREALRRFVGGLGSQPSPLPPSTLAEDAIRRRNCLDCHARDGQGTSLIGTQVTSLLGLDPALGGLKGTLTPPDLTAVGDKLLPASLDQAILGRAALARPWLSVRMPTFAFEPGEAETIASNFRMHDQVRDRSTLPEKPPGTIHPEASRLVGQKGFGCVNCHVLAGKIPPGGEAETLGPDLALAHRRMSRRYFDRWIADPQRIVPGTPMPRFITPITNESGSLNDQLGAIWDLLGSARLGEIASFGTRELLRREGDRALVVRDMVVDPGFAESPYVPRGIAIGLKNGQSLLFDADRLAWIAWWSGGFAYRTKSGRLWEWHPETSPFWTATDRRSPLGFVARDGVFHSPRSIRERFGSFEELAFAGDSVRLTYQLNGPQTGAVSVIESIQPERQGWVRSVKVVGNLDGYEPILYLPSLPRGTGVTLEVLTPGLAARNETDHVDAWPLSKSPDSKDATIKIRLTVVKPVSK